MIDTREELINALHEAAVQNEHSSLPARPDADQPWTADFRIGVWDANALSAWMEGTLTIPLHSN